VGMKSSWNDLIGRDENRNMMRWKNWRPLYSRLNTEIMMRSKKNIKTQFELLPKLIETKVEDFEYHWKCWYDDKEEYEDGLRKIGLYGLGMKEPRDFLSEEQKLWEKGYNEQHRLKIKLYENEFGSIRNIRDKEVIRWLDDPTTAPGSLKYKKSFN
jgi:hypothetical protein